MNKIVAALCAVLFVTTGCSKEPPPLPAAPAAPAPAPLLEIGVAQQAVAPVTLTATPGGDSTMYSEVVAAQTGGNGTKNQHNYGGHEAFCVGTAAATTNGTRRAVLKFTLPGIPASQGVESANLALTLIRARTAGTSMNLLANRLTSAFNEGGKAGTATGMTEAGGNGQGPCGGGGYGVPACPFPTCNPATAAVDPPSGFQFNTVSWSNRTNVAWGTAGGDFTTSGQASAAINISNPTTTFTNLAVNLTVTQIVKDMYTTGNQSGFLLQSSVEGSPVRAVFASNQFATVADRPALTVLYKTVGGGGCGVSNDCLSGLTCVGGICCQSAACDDGNGCTTDSCGGANGTCQFTNNAISCNDGNLCNGTDTCGGGTCNHTGDPCAAQINDGDANCNEKCNPATGACTSPDNAGNTCTDSNGCTSTDVCNGSGTCVGVNNAAACSDGNLCNGADTCSGGGCNLHAGDPCAAQINDGDANCNEKCNPGTGACDQPDLAGNTCNDGNGCTSTDVCNGSGTCAGANNAAACSDGNLCNGADTCSGGACNLHAGDPCAAQINDGDANCSEKCNPATGACDQPDTAGNTCTDGNVCTSTDVCNGSGTCAGANNTVNCNDGNLCNGVDTCGGGTCNHAGDPCAAQINDGDANCSEKCNPATGACDQPDLAGNTCTDGNVCTSTDVCNGSGTCAGANNTVNCNDGNLCNGVDTCGGGTCNHAGDPCAAQVNDGDANCSEKCNPATGACDQADNAGNTCTDGNVCTSNDTCNGSGTCSPGTNNTVNCNDGNLCNGTDTCAAGVCTHAGDPCAAQINDGDANCNEKCNPATGACTSPDLAGNTCSDGNVCTSNDICNGSGACTPGSNNTVNCNDGNLCNGVDTCAAGACTHAGDPCAATLGDLDSDCSESCNPADGSCTLNDPLNSTCDDGVACTHTDKCNGSGTCAGTSITCTSNPATCITLTCNGTSSCASAPRLSGSCDDSNQCTHTDTCNGGGSCVGTGITCTSDPNACATLACNGTSTCASTPRTTGTCNDGNACTHTDTCNGAATCAGTGITCTPDACNGRACNGTSSCTVTPLTGPACNDGDGCTQTDTCAAGTCTGSNPVVCPAPDQCHNAGSCASGTGLCSNPVKPGTPACDDAQACTVGEKCNALGVCAGGTPTDCSASATNDCHAGQCAEPGGCFSQPLTGNPCDDGNACTVGTTCSAGSVCTGGSALPCDDSDPCTTDSCNTADGCHHVAAPDGTACAADSNACTRDTCLAGVCHAPSPAGTVCGPAASCTGTAPTAVSTPAGACNGTTTTCVQNPISCGTQPCAGTTCLGACTADVQCPGQYCDIPTGACKNLLGVGGGVCLRPTMCAGGLTCVDTVCCSTACAGGGNDCQTCNGTSPGTCTPLALNAACSDGLFCNGADKCNASGTCLAGTTNPCPGADGDGNCKESCNEATDSCDAPDPNSSACDDGTFCNVGETCQAGACVGGGARDCSVFTDQCNVGACNEAGSTCQANPVTGTSCNADSSLCTNADQCLSGVCQAGAPLACNDSNSCTTDSCVPATGCSHVTLGNGVGCTVDGNPCTFDTCQGGLCNTAFANGTACGVAASCSGLIPNAAAIPPASCQGGNCTSQSPIACGATVPCNGAACQGGCASDAQCAAGFFCNIPLTTCQPAKVPGGGCTRDAMCQAGTTCVDTVCCTTACGGGVATDCLTCNGAGTAGTCTNQTGTPCDDTLFCNGTDTCNAGACTTHATAPCPGADGDGNCKESCNEATDTCDANDPTGSACDDGLFCTVTEKCSAAGVCGGGGARDCSASGDQCNTAACDETNDVCKGTPLTGNVCNDSSSCTTGEKCAAGVCTGTVNCDDGNPCTDDSCGAGTCVHTANTAPCNDGNACTTNDTCAAKACVGGPALVCDDGNACTDDACNPATGCTKTNNNANTCSDNDGCTTGDHCVTGVCVPTGGKSCDDSNPCTDDTCNGAGVCVNTANTANCDDNNACTSGDKCAAKVCVPGAAVVCDDGKECTDDTCDPTTGCKATNDDTNACSDNNACTNADHCTAGACSGTTISCNDSNVCTDDSCDTTLGCQHANNTLACTDNDTCTTADKCAGGNCVGGPALPCDDSKVCTVDTCAPATGCVFTPGNAGTSCRVANGTCDDPEACDGTNPNCPADLFSGTRICSPATCTLGQETLAAVCNGASGACPTATTQSCGTYTCSGTACGTTCTGPNDCAQGSFCDATSHCNSKGAPGAACSSGGQCASTFCTDGVCCDKDCSGQCEACNLAASRGTCTAVAGPPVGSRTACIGDHTGCDASCDGIHNTACAIPGNSVQCRAPKCANGVATDPAVCDGISGVCPALTTTDCGTSVCGATACTGCATDAQCGTGKFCSSGVCKPISGPGTACTRDFECGTGHCVDSVCCDTVCTGQCESCTVPNKAGVCTAVTGPAPSGKTPCAGTLGKPCVGTCDGTNRRTCAYDGLGTVCQAASCNGSRASVVAFCDGAGVCPPPDQVDCASGCDGTLCAGGCTGACDDPGQYCSGGKCVPLKDPGANCSSNGECTSSFCVDGLCCTSACSGQCQACNLPGTEGVCSTVVGGAPKGSRQPCATDGTNCGGLCDGASATSCSYAGVSTSCRNATCVNGIATLKGTCQGNGSCGPKQLQDCAPNACDTSSVLCANGCTVDGDCAADGSEYCSGGVCVTKLPPGAQCGGPAQCASTHCVDGVCCDKACTGQCEACDQVIGTCTNVTGAPRSGRAACAGAGACGGFCDGTIPSCRTPSQTACGLAFCSQGFTSDAPLCQNTVCVPSQAVACDPYVCEPVDQKTCLTTCNLDDDCAPGLVCNNGDCEAPTPPDAGTGAGGAGSPDGSVVGTGGATSPDAGAGGTAGNAGAGGTAGTAGTSTTDAGLAGTAGTAGATSTGGAAARDAGADARDGGGIINGRDTGSCGCRVPGSRQRESDAPLGLLAVASGLLLLRRRRASTSARTR